MAQCKHTEGLDGILAMTLVSICCLHESPRVPDFAHCLWQTRRKLILADDSLIVVNKIEHIQRQVTYRIKLKPFQVKPGSTVLQAANIFKKPVRAWGA